MENQYFRPEFTAYQELTSWKDDARLTIGPRKRTDKAGQSQTDHVENGLEGSHKKGNSAMLLECAQQNTTAYLKLMARVQNIVTLRDGQHR